MIVERDGFIFTDENNDSLITMLNNCSNQPLVHYYFDHNINLTGKIIDTTTNKTYIVSSYNYYHLNTYASGIIEAIVDNDNNITDLNRAFSYSEQNKILLQKTYFLEELLNLENKEKDLASFIFYISLKKNVYEIKPKRNLVEQVSVLTCKLQMLKLFKKCKVYKKINKKSFIYVFHNEELLRAFYIKLGTSSKYKFTVGELFFPNSDSKETINKFLNNNNKELGYDKNDIALIPYNSELVELTNLIKEYLGD